ncbi:sulfatase family protein [Naumannella huperziae]
MSAVAPNIVLILSDDHGYADRSTLGLRDDIVTPHLDRLAADGTTCTQGYVTAPICSPSRAGLMAGVHQQRWGAYWFDTSSFGDDRPSIAEVLGGAGYRCGYFGKVHYGQERRGDRACPPNHGFDESLYGLAGQSMGRLHYLHHSRAAEERYGPAAWRHGVGPLLAADESGETEAEIERHLTRELGERTRGFIGRAVADQRPFFAMVAFNAVHNFNGQLPAEVLRERGLPPFADLDPAVDDYLDWYDGAIWPNDPNGRAYYAAQLAIMDEEIGLLLDQLDTLGVAEDTLVVYLTDNGGSTCNFAENAPLAGGKYSLYEGGVRVPFLVRWAGGGVPAGGACAELVSSLDLLPTFAAAAGLTGEQVPETDGIDLAPVLRGEGAGHEVLHFDTGFQWAVREGEWKLRSIDVGAHVDAINTVEHAGIEPGVALHHLGRDPGERTDLSETYPRVRERLTALHEAWRAEMAASARR